MGEYKMIISKITLSDANGDNPIDIKPTTLEFENGSRIIALDGGATVRSKGHAAWIRLGDVGFLEHEWQCSACLGTWVVQGIMTPKGLGYSECPNCHAQMLEVIQ